jgi:purine-binding chemotaxis protein CheW
MSDEKPAGGSGEISFEELYRRLDAAEQALSNKADQKLRQEILGSRAKALAQTRSNEKANNREVLAFRVGGERYAAVIEEVDEVLEVKNLFPLLGAPRYVLGAVVARSRVLPVLDLRQLLGLEGGGMSDLTKVVVVGLGDDLFGLAVEEVEGKLELPRQGWQRPPSGPFLHVRADRLAVLDLSQLGEQTAQRPA